MNLGETKFKIHLHSFKTIIINKVVNTGFKMLFTHISFEVNAGFFFDSISHIHVEIKQNEHVSISK